jgi:hypothetical protein
MAAKVKVTVTVTVTVNGIPVRIVGMDLLHLLSIVRSLLAAGHNIAMVGSAKVPVDDATCVVPGRRLTCYSDESS